MRSSLAVSWCRLYPNIGILAVYMDVESKKGMPEVLLWPPYHLCTVSKPIHNIIWLLLRACIRSGGGRPSGSIGLWVCQTWSISIFVCHFFQSALNSAEMVQNNRKTIRPGTTRLLSICSEKQLLLDRPFGQKRCDLLYSMSFNPFMPAFIYSYIKNTLFMVLLSSWRYHAMVVGIKGLTP